MRPPERQKLRGRGRDINSGRWATRPVKFRETERWLERIKTGHRQTARMINKQSQKEKQTIRERQMETQRTRIRDRAEKKQRERRARISRFRIIKSERGENIKQR